jgi:3-oxoacyl-[acyl-carrier-protein] synthase III
MKIIFAYLFRLGFGEKGIYHDYNHARKDSWELRGKHTRGKPMKNQREMLKHVVKTIDEIYQQMVTKADLQIVIAMIAALSPEDQIKLRHLKLV